MSHKLNSLLLSYDKQKGATEGFWQGFGSQGISFGDIGKNKKTLDTGNNRRYFEILEYAQEKNKIPEGKFDVFADKLADKIGEVDAEMIQLAKDTYKTQGSLQGMTKTFENQTSITGKLSTSIKNLGGQFLSSLVNGLVSFAASAVLSAAIQGIQNFIHSEELLAQKTQQIAGKFKEQSTQLSSYSTEISKLRGVLEDETSTTQEVRDATSQLYDIQNDLIDQYGSYHQGIDLVNGDLEDQLKLLRDINRENSQRAINEINSIKSNKVKGSNFIATALESTLLPLGTGQGLVGGKFLNNLFVQNKGFGQSFTDALFGKDLLGQDVGTKIFKDSSTQISSMVEDYNASFKTSNEVIKQLARNYKEAFEVKGNKVTAVGDIYAVNDAVVKLQVQLQELGITDEKVFSALGEMATETSNRINTYGDSYQTIIAAAVQNSGTLAKNYRDLTQKYNEYIEAQDSGDAEKVAQLGKEYQQIFADIANSDIDQKYIDYFKNLYPEMQGQLAQWEFEVKVIPRIEGHYGLKEDIQSNSAEELKTRYNRFTENRDAVDPITKGRFEEMEMAAAEAGYATVEAFIDAIKAMPEYSDEMQHVRDLMGENWSEDFEKEFADKDLTALVDVEPKPDGMAYTKEEIEKMLSPVEVDVETKVKASDAVESMADIKKAVTSVDELWQQTVQNAVKLGRDQKYTDASGNITKHSGSNQAIGFADPELINNVEAAFSKFSDTFKAEGNDQAANEINQALEEFEKTLVEFPGDADKAQGAIDNLITAYIDQTDAIQNLTEENKEWSKAQLKAMGITNAEAVVESRLSSTTKKLAEHFKAAASALQTLTSAQEGSTEYNDAMTSVGDKLGEMFSYTSETGETIVPNFDSTWIIQNLDLLKEAASGSTEAMYELQKAASKKIAAQIEVNAPAHEEIRGIKDYINGLIDSFDISDIEIGTSLDDTPMIQGLNNLVNAGKITRDSMNAILSSIGVEPKIEYEEVDISADFSSAMSQVESMKNTTPGAYTAANEMQKAMSNGSLKGKIKIPKISYQATSKSVGAQYASPSNNDNTGGNTGGSPDSGGKTDKDKVNEDEPEQFDWIQVKIQRLEEEIERLGKKANDTFSSWTNRTKALNKEISKTTAEIKAQQQAQNRYEANFNKIKVNNGKEINEEEYSDNKKQLDYDKDQLKKAKAAWSKLYKDSKGRYYDKNGNITKDKKKAVGHYQYLIQQGKIGKKDIENIPNRFLAETIKNAQEIWQKSVDAGDAVQDLQLQLKELNKQKFDNITTKFSNAMDVISKKSDLIQKKIDRTETMGYFVDESYYKKQRQLLTNNSKNKDKEGQLQKQIRERDEHIAQLNKQTALDKKKGGVDFKSEAWYEMYNQIMDDNVAIEETRNQIAELDKQIKQLSWDKFDYLREKLDDITAEAEYLQEILSSEKMMDDYGFYNNRGWANAAMITVQYKEAQKGMQEVLAQREKLEKTMDKNSQTDMNRWQDLTDKARDYAKAMMAAKDAMKSFVEESRLMLSYPIR